MWNALIDRQGGRDLTTIMDRPVFAQVSKWARRRGIVKPLDYNMKVSVLLLMRRAGALQ